MYRDKLTGQRVSKSELIARNPNISLPAAWDDEVLAILGVDYVKPVAKPEITATQRLVEGAPENRVDGGWYQTWAVQDMEAEEVAALLSNEKDAACARLNGKRDAVKFGVYTDSNGIRYDVHKDGRDNFTGLEAKIANGLVLPDGLAWTDADNIQRPHTVQSILALTTEILVWSSMVHDTCVAAKTAVRAAEDLASIAAIEALVVWP